LDLAFEDPIETVEEQKPPLPKTPWFRVGTNGSRWGVGSVEVENILAKTVV
jgi:hypothetical protein